MSNKSIQSQRSPLERLISGLIGQAKRGRFKFGRSVPAVEQKNGLKIKKQRRATKPCTYGHLLARMPLGEPGPFAHLLETRGARRPSSIKFDRSAVQNRPADERTPSFAEVEFKAGERLGPR